LAYEDIYLALAELAMQTPFMTMTRTSVCPSVRHTLTLCQNDAS